MKGWVNGSAHRCIRLYGDGWPARRPRRHIAGVLSHLDASCRRRISQLHAQQVALGRTTLKSLELDASTAHYAAVMYAHIILLQPALPSADTK